MPLTDLEARNAKPLEKPYKLADSGGMYLEVRPNGSKYWRLKYRFGKKEKLLALGVHPIAQLPVLTITNADTCSVLLMSVKKA